MLRRGSSFASSTLRVRKFLLVESFCLRKIAIGGSTRFAVPVRSRGKGTLLIGERNVFGYGPAPRLGSGEILLQPRLEESQLRIGKNNAFSNNISIIALLSIDIGNDCLIGNCVQIFDSDFHGISIQDRRKQGDSKPVTIGSNVWLGANVIVLKGVTIGDNSVVGAMSLVTRDVPANCIVSGNPARIVRELPV